MLYANRLKWMADLIFLVQVRGVFGRSLLEQPGLKIGNLKKG